jgi:hypothetical protein
MPSARFLIGDKRIPQLESEDVSTNSVATYFVLHGKSARTELFIFGGEASDLCITPLEPAISLGSHQ